MRCTDRNKHIDGVKSGVLCKGAWDNLKRRCERFYGELCPATYCCTVFTETERQFRLNCTATGNNLLVLNNDADNAECIVNCTFKLIDYVLSATLDDN